jgi:hypothetical protein
MASADADQFCGDLAWCEPIEHWSMPPGSSTQPGTKISSSSCSTFCRAPRPASVVSRRTSEASLRRDQRWLARANGSIKNAFTVLVDAPARSWPELFARPGLEAKNKFN